MSYSLVFKQPALALNGPLLQAVLQGGELTYAMDCGVMSELVYLCLWWVLLFVLALSQGCC